jgi:hypothetical protein
MTRRGSECAYSLAGKPLVDSSIAEEDNIVFEIHSWNHDTPSEVQFRTLSEKAIDYSISTWW